MGKVYEAGRFIGKGFYGLFFVLKGYPHIGVKVLKDQDSRRIKREFKKGLILRKLELPVPRCIGIVRIKIPENSEVLGRRGFVLPPEFLGRTMKGIAMEFIDEDIEEFDADKYELYKKGKEKIEKLGIEIDDSCYGRNVLWCPRRKKIYFIDFGLWKLPAHLERHVLKKRSVFKRIFGFD
jgi:hypothetical protein